MTPDEPITVRQEEHREIMDRIRSGQVFVYPTDTAYGLGTSIRNEDAVRRVFELKDRPLEKTVPVLATSVKGREMVTTEEPEERAMETFWPGGLTLVLSVTGPEEYPPGLVRDGTMALRAPGREYLREVLAATPPIVGTSANPSGEKTPYERGDLDPDLLAQVDFGVEGTPGGDDSSTVAEWNSSREEWIVHRSGPVRSEELDDLIQTD
jgi:L-threonylcarbamoyladenylate synthase